MKVYLFFHRDFDGICSAAVFLAYASRTNISDSREVRLTAVDYDLKKSWADTALPRVSAVVDFLYHPDAEWWFDHHPTTFVKAEWELSFKPDRQHVWNTNYKSCPGLILDSVLDPTLQEDLKARFRGHTEWSEIIDMAQYSSPKQVIEAKESALQINLSLAANNDPEYLIFLVRCLEEKSLDEVAALEEVAQWYEVGKTRQEESISYMAQVGERKNGVAFFDLTKPGALFHRYAAYYLWPDTRFAVAVYKNGQGYRITVSSNPWSEFTGPDLGSLSERFGGGGHAQVAGIALSDRRRALKAAKEIAQMLAGEKPYTEPLPFRQEAMRRHR